MPKLFCSVGLPKKKKKAKDVFLYSLDLDSFIQ